MLRRNGLRLPELSDYCFPSWMRLGRGEGNRESDSLPRTAVYVWQRLRSSRQARTASALLQVGETQELVARAPECSRGARRISLSGLEAGVTAAGALRGGDSLVLGKQGAQESL